MGWVSQLIGWIGSGHTKWTHGWPMDNSGVHIVSPRPGRYLVILLRYSRDLRGHPEWRARKETSVRPVKQDRRSVAYNVIFYLHFLFLFKHHRRRAQATYMPIKSTTMNIQGGPRKRGHRLVTILLSNLNRFTKKITGRFLGKFAVKWLLKSHAPCICCYTTLWNINVSKTSH